MTNPVLSLVQKYIGDDFFHRLSGAVVGVGQDFWKDGPDNPFENFKLLRFKAKASTHINEAGSLHKATTSTSPLTSKTSAATAKTAWHALPGEVSEKMWGNGCVTPGDEIISDLLILPLAINKDMSVLDLSAGLGSRLRRTVEKFGVYVTGLEPDPEIAVRGMDISVRAGKGKRAVIAAYDPDNFNHTKRYDCIIARETFYRVKDKLKLMKGIADCSKSRAQLSFTDYIVDPEYREKPGVKAWMAFEKHAAPLSAVEMTEAWAKVGYTIRVHDDQTDLYRKEVLLGLKRLIGFLGSGVTPDADTKKSITRRLATWMYRVQAMKDGMRFYRFFAIKDK